MAACMALAVPPRTASLTTQCCSKSTTAASLITCITRARTSPLHGSHGWAGTGAYLMSDASERVRSRVKVDKAVVGVSSTGLQMRRGLAEAEVEAALDPGDAESPEPHGMITSFPAPLSGKGWRVAAASALAALTLFQSGDDVALAYKGGGPYGIGVTRGQDLSYKDFSGQDLTKQDFKTSILRQTKFKGAKLLGASFFDADLTGADFSESDLRGADFSLASAKGADFTNANLEGALVTGNTSFKGSIITGADFTDVNFREDQRRELCQVASGVNPLTGNETRTTLFCQ